MSLMEQNTQKQAVSRKNVGIRHSERRELPKLSFLSSSFKECARFLLKTSLKKELIQDQIILVFPILLLSHMTSPSQYSTDKEYLNAFEADKALGLGV